MRAWGQHRSGRATHWSSAKRSAPTTGQAKPEAVSRSLTRDSMGESTNVRAAANASCRTRRPRPPTNQSTARSSSLRGVGGERRARTASVRTTRSSAVRIAPPPEPVWLPRSSQVLAGSVTGSRRCRNVCFVGSPECPTSSAASRGRILEVLETCSLAAGRWLLGRGRSRSAAAVTCENASPGRKVRATARQSASRSCAEAAAMRTPRTGVCSTGLRSWSGVQPAARASATRNGVGGSRTRALGTGRGLQIPAALWGEWRGLWTNGRPGRLGMEASGDGEMRPTGVRAPSRPQLAASRRRPGRPPPGRPPVPPDPAGAPPDARRPGNPEVPGPACVPAPCGATVGGGPWCSGSGQRARHASNGLAARISTAIWFPLGAAYATLSPIEVPLMASPSGDVGE